MTDYSEISKILKSLSDPNRLKILDLLSCGELCACDLLNHFDFSQPTLSHHMKSLMECQLVTARKEGTWMRYQLNLSNANQMMYFLMGIITPKSTCICNDGKGDCNE